MRRSSDRPRLGALALAALVAALSGCGGSTPEADADAGGTGDADESGSAGEGLFDPDECMSSEDCDGGYCVAPWTGAPPRGPAQCLEVCVEALDLQQFCIDDAACCEGLSCSVDGLCEPPWDETTGDGDGDRTGDGDGDLTGDGDGDLTGDGDGDPTGDGDGDLTGDGDGDLTGDGDGDLTGDGDGDLTGDGDGDPP